jgi:hypothetical protein
MNKAKYYCGWAFEPRLVLWMATGSDRVEWSKFFNMNTTFVKLAGHTKQCYILSLYEGHSIYLCYTIKPGSFVTKTT